MWKFGSLWAGSEESFDTLLASSANVAAMIVDSTQEVPLPDLLHLEGSVGVVSIEGTLVPGDAGFWAYFGAVGYNDIRTALTAAAMNPQVKSILLNMNSGGGAVDGCQDCANYIAQIDAVKPVIAYADGQLGSGAYWLASSARQIIIGTTTQAGSVGVIAKAAEFSKARAAAGITDLVVRSGKYKQLINAVEPHTKLAIEELQATVDDIAAVFLSHVSAARNTSAEAFDAKMGQGRVFTGAKAAAIGLVDEVANYESALSAAIAAQPVDSRIPAGQNTRQSTGAQMTRKATMNAADLAALASGATLPAGTNQAAAEQTQAGEQDATGVDAAAAAAALAVAPTTTTTPATPAADDAAAPAATAAGAPATESELVKFLRSELATANATLTANAVELDKLRTASTGMSATHPKLLDIARGAVKKMRIALGASGDGADAMSAEEVINAHAETSATFAKKFVVGGAAATSSSAEEKPEASTKNVLPLFAQVARAAK